MDRLEERKAGRSSAIAVFLLADSECQGKSANFISAFWDEFFNQLLKAGLGLPEQESTPVALKPMNDEEAREFRKEELVYGVAKGMTIAEIESSHDEAKFKYSDGSGLGYLRWIANDDFQEQLRRYLARDEFKNQG